VPTAISAPSFNRSIGEESVAFIPQHIEYKLVNEKPLNQLERAKLVIAKNILEYHNFLLNKHKFNAIARVRAKIGKLTMKDFEVLHAKTKDLKGEKRVKVIMDYLGEKI